MDTAKAPETAPAATVLAQPSSPAADRTQPDSTLLRCYGATPSTPPITAPAAPADTDRAEPASNLHTGHAGAGLPADLAEVLRRWPTLPEPLKAAVLALMRAAQSKD